MMDEKRKALYEEARLEILLLDLADVITTSTTMGDDDENFDDKAWT